MAIPAVKLIPVPTIAPVPDVRTPGATLSHGAKQSPQTQSSPADLRWSRVEGFFRSRELRPNTHKSYEREFKAFLGWTEKGWQDITARDLDRYKEYLKALPSGRGGKRSTATINLSLSALQSLFKIARSDQDDRSLFEF
jgi:integrase/recombinase XerD